MLSNKPAVPDFSVCRKASSSTPFSSLKYSIAKPSEFEEVVEFFSKYFTPTEPLSKRLTEHFGTKEWLDRDKRILSALKDNLSLLGRNDGRLVVAYVNSICNRTDPKENVEDYTDPKFRTSRKILNFARMNYPGNLFDELDTDVLIEAKMMTVHPDYRHMNLSSRTVLRQQAILKVLGYHGIITEMTCMDTGLIGQRMFNYKCISEYPLADYEEDGTKIFGDFKDKMAYFLYCDLRSLDLNETFKEMNKT